MKDLFCNELCVGDTVAYPTYAHHVDESFLIRGEIIEILEYENIIKVIDKDGGGFVESVHCNDCIKETQILGYNVGEKIE